ncbi:MAG: YidC/Oxa1 family insertase periplasmic-domain containing protein [Phycisphaerales bacterium]|nr:YidC/Oxa1 family insertase periplasmic-domain containing protein [Phycisphaerales bacterium]
MAAKTNTPLRIIVPILLLLGGVGIAVIYAKGGKRPTAPAQQREVAKNPAPAASDPSDALQVPAEGQPGQTEAGGEPGEAPEGGGAGEPAPGGEPGSAAPGAVLTEGPAATAYRAVEFASSSEVFAPTPIGALDPEGPAAMRVEFSRYGAGVASIELAGHFESIRRQEHVRVQREVDFANTGMTPLSVESVTIDGVVVPLQAVPGPDGKERRVWQEVAPGSFRAEIRDGEDRPIVEITRQFTLESGSYELGVRQRVCNLSGRPVKVALSEYGPVEIEDDISSIGDRRRVRVGHLLSTRNDPSRTHVVADGELRSRSGVIGGKKAGVYPAVKDFWPTKTAASRGYELVWIAQTSRYFAVAVHSPQPEGGVAPLGGGRVVQRVVANTRAQNAMDAVLGLRFASAAQSLAPGAEADLDLVVYAGPLQKSLMNAEEGAKRIALGEAVAFNAGGMCGWCTFDWLTTPILGLLRVLHNYVVFDWALAIIVLVLIVRSILHPVTRWTQIRMQMMGKQMQAIAPRLKKIEEKYANDPKAGQMEKARLMREAGVGPMGCLAFLTAFLQTPVWLAVYAVIFYAFELRQQPAFFGVFQSMTGGAWSFLADLAQPDRAVWFRHGPTLPIFGRVDSINVLPVVLGVVFFLQQKYLTPPQASANLTPEQRQQQAIVRWIIVFVFPLFMYNSPSGLTLYFVANSTLGIFESRWIRAHIAKHDLLNPEKLAQRKQAKPGGFLDRLRKAAEQQQQARSGKTSTMPGPGKGVAPRGTPGKGKPPPDRFKKR